MRTRFCTFILAALIQLAQCQNCSNGGTWLEDKCVCANGFEGVNCTKPICLNGGKRLENENTCDCSASKYDGERCELPKCLNNGKLVKGECECEIHHEGTFCEQNACYYGSRDPNSDEPDKCRCSKGWQGERCDVKYIRANREKGFVGGGKNAFLLAIGMGLCLGFVLILGVVAYLFKNCLRSRYYSQASTTQPADKTSAAQDQDWQDAFCGL